MLLNICIALCLLAPSWAAAAPPPPPGACSTNEDCKDPLEPCCSPWGYCGDIVPWCTSPPPASPPPPSPSPPPPSPPPPPGACSTNEDCKDPLEPCCSPWGYCGDMVPWCTSSPPPPSPPPPSPSPPPPSPPPQRDSSLFGSRNNGVFFYDGPGTITALRVRSGCVINGIQIQIDSTWQPFRGSASGSLSEVPLSANEYIYKISGRTGVDTTCGSSGAGEDVIHLQLGIKNVATGQVRSTSFGRSKSGTSFSSQEGEIVAFWGYGSTTSYMKGIGVTFKSCPSSGAGLYE